jgi:hypothetical protein
MQGKPLSQVVGESFQMDFDSDSVMFDTEAASKSALQREQNRIEKEIADFEKHIWAAPVDSVALARQDSIAAAEATSKKAKKASTRSTARQTTSKAEKTKKEKAPSSGGSAPRVSVRRERH